MKSERVERLRRFALAGGFLFEFRFDGREFFFKPRDRRAERFVFFV